MSNSVVVPREVLAPFLKTANNLHPAAPDTNVPLAMVSCREWRALAHAVVDADAAPQPADLRERVAALIYPTAFEPRNDGRHVSETARKEARLKADAILALLQPSPVEQKDG